MVPVTLRIGSWDPLREALLQGYEVHDSAVYQMTNECVFLDRSLDIAPIDTIFQKRTELWNSTMKQLEFPYRTVSGIAEI